jgi:hypothetical protein
MFSFSSGNIALLFFVLSFILFGLYKIYKKVMSIILVIQCEYIEMKMKLHFLSTELTKLSTITQNTLNVTNIAQKFGIYLETIKICLPLINELFGINLQVPTPEPSSPLRPSRRQRYNSRIFSSSSPSPIRMSPLRRSREESRSPIRMSPLRRSREESRSPIRMSPQEEPRSPIIQPIRRFMDQNVSDFAQPPSRINLNDRLGNLINESERTERTQPIITPESRRDISI